MSLAKDIFFSAGSLLGLPEDRAIVLMYHSLSPVANIFMNVEPFVFAQQLAYIAALKRPVISLAELVRRLSHGERLGGSIVITFDDGYRDNRTVAYPVLERYKFPATIFVQTGLIGCTDHRDLERLSEEDLHFMHATGLIDIQPHTISHPKLSRLDASRARDEVLGSKKHIEAVLGKTCGFFAYPFGDHTAETKHVVADAGFQAAVTVHEGTVGPECDMLQIPRVSIDSSTSRYQFAGKLSRAVDCYEYLKRAR